MSLHPTLIVLTAHVFTPPCMFAAARESPVGIVTSRAVHSFTPSAGQLTGGYFCFPVFLRKFSKKAPDSGNG